MSASTYIHGIDAVTGVRRNVARLADVLGADQAPAPASTAMVPVTTKTSAAAFFRNVGGTERDVPDNLGTPIGLVAGVILCPSHRVLGGIGGASLGRNVPALFNPDDRKLALRNLATTGAGIAGSRAMPGSPVIGFVLGSIVGGLGSYFAGLK